MNPTEYLNRFDAALWAAHTSRAAGAYELFSLYQSMFDDVPHDEVLPRLDAYKDDASLEAQALYLSIVRKITA